MLSVKQGDIKYQFLRAFPFMPRPGIEPRSPGPLANILLISVLYITDFVTKWKKKKKSKQLKTVLSRQKVIS